jgi:catechol 2,3-dioxygenase-like lactoylglutathione lyase family enzyme
MLSAICKEEIFVSNMDASIRFYTDVLGMKLAQGWGNEFAMIEGRDGLTIGSVPRRRNRQPGKSGSGSVAGTDSRRRVAAQGKGCEVSHVGP